KALIQAADAARYPSFSLSASGGVASNELLSLSNPTSTLSAGLGLSYNLFDYGKLKNNVLIAESKANEALQNYRKTLLQAFGEVEEALSNLALAKEQATHTQNLVEELLFSLGLTDTRHKYGAVDFETLLNAQKSYISTKQQAIDTLEAKLTALVTLHKALGGGFKLVE
ncbi:MAG: TolC family protein, partial [Sulfurimonadaceae bacterium]